MRNKPGVLILFVIFLLAFVLRFYKLGEIPHGFYQDESAIGYNAFSIMENGRDEHGGRFPLYFKSFGDYKLPVYIYVSTIAVKLFGLNEFAVRFPSAFFGFSTVIIFYFFIYQLTKRRSLSLVSTSLLAINPWHIHYSRATFEVSIVLFLFVLGALLLYRAFYQKQPGAFLGGTFCFVISIYAYNLTRLLSPALYVLLIFFFREEAKKLNKKEVIVAYFSSALFLIPFIKTILQSGGVSSAAGTLIWTSSEVQARLLEFRSYFVDTPSLFAKLFFNQLALTTWQYLNNIASYFSIPFFFISGSTHGNHGIGNVGQFYMFELVFIIVGIGKIFLEKFRWGIFMLWWVFVVILVASLTREAPHATRSFFLIAPLVALSGLGALSVWRKIWSVKRELYRKILFLIFAGFILYNLVYYFSSYYVRFPILYAKAWRSADKPLSLFIKENQAKYDKIIFDKEAGFIYTSLLFYSAYSPFQFQKTAGYYPDDSEGFSMVKSFGKFEFREIDWTKDYGQKKLLFITTVERKPAGISPLKAFYYPKRPVVLAIKQEIIQYLIEETAYVLVESKSNR